MNFESVLASIIVAAITGYITFRIQERRLKAEMKTEYMAENAVKLLLGQERWRKRSFGEIKKRLGDGFTDPELRKLLVRSGAVRFESTGTNDELWGLIERNKDDL